MATPAFSFLFGPGTNESPESIKRKRDIARALLGAQGAPRNVGEGLNALGDGIVSAVLNSRADKAEKTGMDSAASDFAPLLGGFGTSAPSTPGATGSSMPKVDAAGNVALPSTGKEWATVGPRLTSDLAKDFQLSPEQAAGVVGQLGQESAGFGSLQEKNPVVPGSRGGFGYAQWTGPRRKQFEAYAQANGLDPTSYEANYGFLKNELANTPEGAVLGDLRNAPDAMTAGRVFTDKFLRPGIPHYDSRDAWTKRALAFANTPTEVASLDPSAGMPPAPASAYVDPAVTTDYRPETAAGAINAAAPLPTQPQQAPQQPSPAVAQALMAPQNADNATGAIQPQIDPQSALPPLPVSDIGPTPNVASAAPVADTGQQPNQQVAQALLRQDQSGVGIGGGAPAPDSGYFPAPPGAPGQSGPSQAQILRVLTNPYASDSQKAVANALLQRNMEASDPDAQLNRDLKRAQISSLTGKQAGYQVLTPAERKQLGIPDTDQRVYQRGPNGQIDAVGGAGQTINVGNEVEARRQAAAQAGLKPEDPAYQGFILTGKLPKENEQNLTATDKKAILEADEMVQNTQNVLPLLDRALELNEKAYYGPGAGIRSTIMGAAGSEDALATQELDNVVTAGALQQLKAIFGGAPTEGERAILLDMSGSSSKPPEVRKSIYERAKQLAQRRLDFYKDRANDIRGGTYYKPGETQQMPSVPDASASPVVPGVQPQAPAPTDDIGTMPAPAGMDENVWKFVPPEDRRLWLKK